MHRKFIRLGCFAALLTACLACGEDALQSEVDSRLLASYFQLVQNGDYNSAYQTYPSPKYRNHTTLEEYKNSYLSNIAKKGPLEKYEIIHVRRYKNIFGAPDEYRAEVYFFFEKAKNAKPITFILSSPAEGTFLIDAGWHNPKYSIPDGLDGPF